MPCLSNRLLPNRHDATTDRHDQEAMQEMAQADYRLSLAHASDSSSQPLRVSRHPGVRLLPEYASLPSLRDRLRRHLAR